MPDGSLVIYEFNGLEWVKKQLGEQSIIANSVTANHIKSLAGLNVNDQFVVDENGNVEFAGHLEGASGTFGEVTVKDGDFQLEKDGLKQLVAPKRNLLNDHNFEMISFPSSESSVNTDYWWINAVESEFWRTHGSPKTNYFYHIPDDRNSLPVFGDKSIIVRNANYVSQIVNEGISGNSTYTISAHFKRQWNVPTGGTPRFEVDLFDGHMGVRKARLINEIFPEVPN